MGFNKEEEVVNLQQQRQQEEEIIISSSSSVSNNNIIMASNKIINTNNHHHQNYQQQQQIPINQFSYQIMHQSSSSSSIIPSNFINSKDGAYDLGELDQALLLYLDDQNQSSVQDQREGSSGMRPPTLNIFPSQPMHVEPSTKIIPEGLGSSGTKRSSEQPPTMKLSNNPRNSLHHHSAPESSSKSVKQRESSRKGPTSSSEQDGPNTPDPKTLRRLAQNREAARKSRLRKKAYVQQLESSRIKLTQLEQELQRARSNQGGFYGDQQGLPLGMNNMSPDAAVFDMEYTRWLEEHHRLMCELRAAVQEHLPENELRMYVENCLAHFDEVITLKGMVAKADVFHIVSGMWKTPAERCFMWIGGFRPSELIKVILSQIEPLTEQQIMGICGLQQSTQEGEEALSQGLEALNQSLSDTIASDSLIACPPNMANYMGQMALAMNKLSTLEGFVRQADSLRHQCLHRLHQLLTVRQSARCLLAIAEYFHRLRALSSLWMARPRQE